MSTYRNRMKNFWPRQDKLPLSLAVFVKDVEECLPICILSVAPVVSEIIVLDTGSSDNTVQVARNLGAVVYQCGFSDFGQIRTTCFGLARQPYVLMLDADEAILEKDLPVLETLLLKFEDDLNLDVINLPRKRWGDIEMTLQIESESYPDLQSRLLRNSRDTFFYRRVHEIVSENTQRYDALDDGICIHHFQDVFKKGEKLKHRNAHYKELYELDIKDGVKHDGKAVEAIDEDKENG